MRANLPQCLVSCPNAVRWAREGAAVARRARLRLAQGCRACQFFCVCGLGGGGGPVGVGGGGFVLGLVVRLVVGWPWCGADAARRPVGGELWERRGPACAPSRVDTVWGQRTRGRTRRSPPRPQKGRLPAWRGADKFEGGRGLPRCPTVGGTDRIGGAVGPPAFPRALRCGQGAPASTTRARPCRAPAAPVRPHTAPIKDGSLTGLDPDAQHMLNSPSTAAPTAMRPLRAGHPGGRRGTMGADHAPGETARGRNTSKGPHAAR